jgi:hypothetical protein
MTRPEDAARLARERADARRATGDYPADTSVPPFEHGDRVTAEQLREWALIEVDPELVQSTRAGGAPITGFKRLLVRLLRQYTTELQAQQTRFNVGVLARLRELEERVERLERDER